MIYGIGVDIVEIDRFRKIINRHGDNFAKKVLAVNEYDIYLKSNNKETYLSKCWAVKEAFVKAKGTGFTGVYKKTDITYNSPGDCRPTIEVSDEIASDDSMRNITINLSVSDEISNVVAFVILEHHDGNPI
jgi:holo-[acyl-carrier protein] synthase|tara:strand:- start:936 stop:1328 length:393 start_codon:yes stop_codon:yes gene_type:complete